jgi:DeoR/GlpR family transcriptional regulator of sugar metabolism
MSDPILLPSERQRLIQEWLARDGRIIAADFARDLRISEDTIRRDLRELAQRGQCRRVYGGALPLSPAGGPIEARRGEAVERKEELARAAAALVEPGQFLFLDAGTTTQAIARMLPGDARLTVATNAPAIAVELSQRVGFDVILIGGRMDRDLGAVLGAAAVRSIESLSPDLAFIGACAVDPDMGIQAFAYEDSLFKQAVAARSRSVAVAATSEKLRTRAPFSVLGAAEVDRLILEADAPSDVVVAFERLGVAVQRAGRPT